MANPTLPILATGGLVIVGGWRREGRWPREGTKAMAATVVLLIVASATAETRAAPVVSALGWLAFLGAVYVVVPGLTKPKVG